MQGAPQTPETLLPKACSVALAHPEDPVAAELASASEGAVPPDHPLPLARRCWGAAGPHHPGHLDISNYRQGVGCGNIISLSVFQRLCVLTPADSCLILVEVCLLLGSPVSWKEQV